jgi:hypothetical protein
LNQDGYYFCTFFAEKAKAKHGLLEDYYFGANGGPGTRWAEEDEGGLVRELVGE